jgi:hypothetical protein
MSVPLARWHITPLVPFNQRVLASREKTCREQGQA